MDDHYELSTGTQSTPKRERDRNKDAHTWCAHSVREAVGGVPSVGDLHPTDKSKRQLHASLDTLVVIFIILTTLSCVVLSLSLFGTLDACA